MRRLVMLTLMIGVPMAVPAQDRTELERAPIIGNRELPKVLYIVPWKKPLPAPLAGRPPTSVLDEPPAPVDRDVLRRQLRYEALIRTETQTHPERGETR